MILFLVCAAILINTSWASIQDASMGLALMNPTAKEISGSLSEPLTSGHHNLRVVTFAATPEDNSNLTLYNPNSPVIPQRGRFIASPTGKSLIVQAQEKLGAALGDLGIAAISEDLDEELQAALLELVLRGRTEVFGCPLEDQFDVDKVVERIVDSIFTYDEERKGLYLHLLALLDMIRDNLDSILEDSTRRAFFRSAIVGRSNEEGEMVQIRARQEYGEICGKFGL